MININEPKIMQAIRELDAAQGLHGALLVSKVAKRVDVPVEQAAEVVDDLIARGEAHRFKAHSSDEFTYGRRDR